MRWNLHLGTLRYDINSASRGSIPEELLVEVFGLPCRDRRHLAPVPLFLWKMKRRVGPDQFWQIFCVGSNFEPRNSWKDLSGASLSIYDSPNKNSASLKFILKWSEISLKLLPLRIHPRQWVFHQCVPHVRLLFIAMNAINHISEMGRCFTTICWTWPLMPVVTHLWHSFIYSLC